MNIMNYWYYHINNYLLNKQSVKRFMKLFDMYSSENKLVYYKRGKRFANIFSYYSLLFYTSVVLLGNNIRNMYYLEGCFLIHKIYFLQNLLSYPLLLTFKSSYQKTCSLFIAVRLNLKM